MKRNLLIFVVALPLLFLAVLLFAGKHSPPKDAPLPNPNGYDLLLTAAGMLQGDPDAYYKCETMGQAELAALVATNQQALALACSALTNECRVPVHAFTAFSSTDIGALRRLAFTMTAKGRLAELDNAPATAAQDYLDVIRLGMKAGRGGPISDAICGIGNEGTGQRHLESLDGQLDAASCRSALDTLESLDSTRETWNDVLDRENLEIRSKFPGIGGRIRFWYNLHKEVSRMRINTKKAFLVQQAKTRSLEIRLAARAYELDAGKPPHTIKDLVPRYLKAIPYDPIAGKDMAYSSP